MTDRTKAIQAWRQREPGRLIGKGHPAGDFLEAYNWDLLEERAGYLKVRAQLPEQVRNPRGQLFGGFTPTYVDMIALMTAKAGTPPEERFASWLATTNMRVDYFEPITGTFVVESELEKRRGRTCFVVTRFWQDETLCAYAVTTMRDMPVERTLGDA